MRILHPRAKIRPHTHTSHSKDPMRVACKDEHPNYGGSPFVSKATSLERPSISWKPGQAGHVSEEAVESKQVW
jgi:hypothetical protein